MNPHPPRSAPPAPLRLRLYAWAAGLFLGALEGVLAIEVAGARGAALPLLGAVAAAMVLGTFVGRPLARNLGRRRMGLLILGFCTGISGTTFIVGRVSRHKLNDKSREDLEALPATTLISNTEPGMFRGAPQKNCRSRRNMPGSGRGYGASSTRPRPGASGSVPRPRPGRRRPARRTAARSRRAQRPHRERRRPRRARG